MDRTQPPEPTQPATTPAPDPARMLDLLRRQRTLYRALSSLAARQRHLISGDQPQALLDLLGRRQRIVEQLRKVHAELTHLPPPDGAAWTEADRREAAGLLADARTLARRILEQDQQDGELLAVRKASLAASLTKIRGTQAANRAYASAAGAPDPPSADVRA